MWRTLFRLYESEFTSSFINGARLLLVNQMYLVLRMPDCVRAKAQASHFLLPL